MKKLIFILVLFSCYFSSAQIQLRPGVKAGLNSSNLTNSSLESKLDFYAGIFLTVDFVDFYHLQPELIYSRQGGKSNSNLFNSLELNYLTLNIANKFFPFQGLGLHAIVGPSFDFKISDNYDSNFGDGFDPTFRENIVGFDFGLFAGVGYELPFGLSVEARYKQGFVDVFGENYNDTVSFDDLFANKVIQIGVTYQFDL